MSDVTRSGNVLAISDGRTGNTRQAEALASTLVGSLYTTQVLKPRIPWLLDGALLSPRCQARLWA